MTAHGVLRHVLADEVAQLTRKIEEERNSRRRDPAAPSGFGDLGTINPALLLHRLWLADARDDVQTALREAHLRAVATACEKVPSDLLDALHARRAAAAAALAARHPGWIWYSLLIAPMWRLVVGHGEDSVHETGLALSPTYGVPVLPGTALKGLAAATARAAAKDRATDRSEDGIDVDIGTLFGTPRPQQASGAHRGSVLVWDGLPIDPPRLVLDVLTPHVKDYYDSGNTNGTPDTAAGRGVSGLKELWDAEEAVFGSTGKPSAIGLRVPKQPTMGGRGSKPDWATTERHGFDGAQYLLGQGLWDYGEGLRRGFVEPGAEFLLDIRFSRAEQVNARFMLALWAWLTYGGLGARTRRGFGQLVCTGVRGDLPCGWRLNDLLPPADVDGWQTIGRCAVPGSLPGHDALGWGELLPEDAPVDELPELPALVPLWWAGFMLDEEADSLDAVLHLAGLRWRRFRAADGSDYLDPEKKPGSSTRSPEWTKVIHGTDRRYPIAAFGLPVGYFSHSQGRTLKATVTPHLGDKQLRRASPVWLRPVRLRDGRWGVFTHVFFAQLLPPESQLRVTGGVTRTLPLPPIKDVRETWNNWISGEPRLPDGYFPES